MKPCYKKGQVLLIKYPHTDYSTWKIRPITSVSHEHTFKIKSLDQKNLAMLFPKTSFVRYDKLFTLASDLVVKDLGYLSADFVTKAKNAFIYHLSH